MPIPKPHTEENRTDYMSRCIEFLINEGKDNEQAVAICSTTWEENKTQKTGRMKYTAKQILNDKKGALNEKFMETSTKNKKSVHIATKQAVNGDTIRAAGNVFNFFDYDGDVLTPGSVTETLKNRDVPVYHLKDHKFSTDGLIGNIKQIGVEKIDLEQFGAVEALTFESKIKGFDWYKEGVISQHSIGFRYDEIVLAIRDDNGTEEEKNWLTYIDNVINKEEVNDFGYFYLVSKIELYEISAVLRGANRLTTTLKAKDYRNAKTAAELINNLKFTL